MTTRIAYLSSAIAFGAVVAEFYFGNPALSFLVNGTYMLLLAAAAIIVGSIPRRRRTGMARLFQQIVGWPMFIGSLVLMVESCRTLILMQVPQWMLITLVFWTLTYLAWKVFLYPNLRRDDGDGDRPLGPISPTGSGFAKPEPLKLPAGRKLIYARDYSHLN